MKKLLSATLAALIGLSSASVLAVNAAEAPGFVMADSDGDGVMSVQDATLIQKYLVNLSDLANKGLLASDVDGDGEVMINDATHVQKLLVGLENPDSLPSSESEASIKEKGSRAMNDFSAKLLKSSVGESENILVSPLSVMYALSMTANGAKGQTLDEMEKTLGLSNYEMNRFFQAYPSYIRYKSEGYYDDFSGIYHPAEQLNIANSIWFNNSEGMPKVSKSFLQSSKDFYNADVFSAEFNDDALDQINGWVNEKTNQMIPSILDYVEPSALMYLINAISFEAEWYEQYDLDYDLETKVFANSDGTNQDADFLYSSEYQYISDGDRAEGFLKNYRDYNYTFAAILPKEGTSINDYVNSLTGERIYDMLNNSSSADLRVWLPKFRVEYSDELKDNLKSMGMKTPFENNADFGRMLANPSGIPLKVDDVLHKTFIELNESGTKAAAATVVYMNPGAAIDPNPPKPKYLYFTRPFVYMIINRDTKTPVFIGTIDNLTQAMY